MESPCECGIEPPGSISHGVSYLIILKDGVFERMVLRRIFDPIFEKKKMNGDIKSFYM